MSVRWLSPHPHGRDFFLRGISAAQKDHSFILRARKYELRGAEPFILCRALVPIMTAAYYISSPCFCNHRSVVLYCQTPSILIPHFCEVSVYTLKVRRRVYVVETVYIIHSQPYSNRHYEQIMRIFHLQHPVLMYLSSPRQVYSTEKLRSRNRHFFRYFHDSINHSKVALIFTGDSVLNRTLAE